MFKTFATAVKRRYETLASKELFVVDVDDLFASYLAAFPEGTNPIFRTRTEHDGNYDKNFVRRLGVLVHIDDKLERHTVWDGMDSLPHPYNVVAKTLSEIVKQAPITGVFRTKERNYGHKPNVDNHDASILWTHFYGEVGTLHYTTDPDKVRGDLNTTGQMFKKALETLSADAFDTVIDLIESKSIYRGEEHLTSVKGFRKLIQMYTAASDKTAFVWANIKAPQARFRNTAIGTLLVDVSAGEDIEVAVKKFESKVAPENYKRTTALITPKMAENAVAKLAELGLEGAVHRRFARLGDVSINNVLWADRAKQKDLKGGLMELLAPATTSKPVDLKHVEKIGVQEFFDTILPTATAMDMLVRNRHSGNFVSLTTADDTAKLFQWDNQFAWSYDGEVTDTIKEKVKRAGGKTDVPLRVSLLWHNGDDLDIHATAPEGHIYYRDRKGVLDVDMNGMDRKNEIDPVENLAWRNPRDGDYTITVNQFSKKTPKNPGFTIELWANGESKLYSYGNEVMSKFNTQVLSFTMVGGKLTNLKVANIMVPESGSNDKWGIKTETRVPVDTLMLSPNHWDGQSGKGNKHWFFFLRGCSNPDATRGIYNEFLRPDLNEHRKVFEVLGSKTKCEPIPDGLSGLGFSSTRDDSATVVITTANGDRRAYNLQF